MITEWQPADIPHSVLRRIDGLAFAPRIMGSSGWCVTVAGMQDGRGGRPHHCGARASREQVSPSLPQAPPLLTRSKGPRAQPRAGPASTFRIPCCDLDPVDRCHPGLSPARNSAAAPILPSAVAGPASQHGPNSGQFAPITNPVPAGSGAGRRPGNSVI